MKTILSCRDRSNQVCSMTKIRQDNNVTYRIGLVYTENDIELFRPIGLGVVCDKTKQDNDMINLTCATYVENETKLS